MALDPDVSPWSWRVLRLRDGLDALAEDWEALAEATSAPPLARPEWAAGYGSAFEQASAPIHVHALYSKGRLVAVLPLARSAGWLPAWTSLSNVHAPYAAYAALDPGPEMGAEVLRHLFEDAASVDFVRVYEDALARALLAAGRSRRVPTLREEVDREVSFELAAAVPGSEAEDRLKRHRRSLRQMEKLGKVEMQVVTEREGLEDRLAECFELETEGWKGASGAPMAARPDTRRLYTDLASSAADRGRLALFGLRLDGRLVAFDYALRSAARVDSLKCAYAPDLARCSPGNVLSLLSLRHEIERGVVKNYHYGRFDVWKERWSTRLDPLLRLRLYRPTLAGRLLHATPSVRAGLRRVGWLRALVTRLQAARDRVRRRR